MDERIVRREPIISSSKKPTTPLAYFINIHFSQKTKIFHEKLPKKIRIKIPTLIANTLRKKPRWNTPRKFLLGESSRKFFSKRINSFLRSALGDKKSMRSSGISESSHAEEIELEPAYDKSGSCSDDSISFKVAGVDGKKPLFSEFSSGTRSPLCDLRGREIVKRNTTEKICITCRQPYEEEDQWLYSSDEDDDEEQEWDGKKMCFTCGIVSSMFSRDDQEDEDKEDNNELCKKRILMGERCKPLDFSGIIHYDEDGNPIQN